MKKAFFILLTALLVLAAGCAQKSAPIRGQHVEPGYTYEEPGHWELTDTLTFDTDADPEPEKGYRVSLTRNEKGYAVFTFTVTEDANFSGEEGHSCKGETAAFTVEAFWFGESYYPSSSVQPGFNIIREADTDHTPGDVVCFLGIGNVGPDDSSRWGVKADALGRFTTVKGEEIVSFSISENMTQSTGYDGKKYYLTPTGHLPAGEEDGEKIYVWLSAMNGGEGLNETYGVTRAYTAWEYSWVAQPETIVVEDRYGPIEYFGASSPGFHIFVLALCVLIVAAAVVILLVRRAKKRKK